MDRLSEFIERRTSHELTLLVIVAAIMIFAAGIRFGEFLAIMT